MTTGYQYLDLRVWGKDQEPQKGTSQSKPVDDHNPGVDSDEETQKTKQVEPEYRIKWVKPVEPEHGFEKNKRYCIEGEIEPLMEKLSRPSVQLYPIGSYKGEEDNFFPQGIKAEINRDTNHFRAECKYLFYPENFIWDCEKTDEDKWELVITANGSTAEKPVDSEILAFPRESKFIELRNGHYDRNGKERYNPSDEHNFKDSNVVKDLQKDLITTAFLPGESDDGFFGPQTEGAVKEFQKFALGESRMTRSEGKIRLEKVTLNLDGPTGIFCRSTKDELDQWCQKNWVKPVPVLRRGDYDDTWVHSRNGKEDGENHHQGQIVTEFQNLLKQVDAYKGEIDGFYGEKTEEAVADLQECARDGTFLLNGGALNTDDKLTHFYKGVLGLATQQYLIKAKENGWKIVEGASGDGAMILYAPLKNKYLIVEPAKIDALRVEAEEQIETQKEIAELRCMSSDQEVNEQLAEKAEELEEKVKEKFSGLTMDPSSSLQELLAVKSNKRWGKVCGRMYIKSSKVDGGEFGRWYDYDDQELAVLKDEWLKELDEKPDEKEKVKTSLKAVLWQSDQIDTQWPWGWRFKPDATEADTEAGYINASADIQFFRFIAGSQASADFDLNEKRLKVGADGNMSFGLVDGSVKGSWSLPQKAGFSIYDFLFLSDNAKDALKTGSDCRFRFTVSAEGKVFVGVSVAAAAALPCIDFDLVNSVSVGASGGGSVGAAVEAKLGVSVEWGKTETGSFESLTETGKTVGGNVGIAAEAKFEFTYEDGILYFKAGATAAKGIGGKGAVIIVVNVDNAVKLFSHIFDSVQWHRVDSVTRLAFEVFANVMFAHFVVRARVTQAVVNRVSEFRSWLENLGRSSREMSETKDCIRSKISKENLDASPPETIGHLLITIMESPSQEDFQTIETILSTEMCRHKLKWIIRNAQSKVDISGGANEEIKKKALDAGVRTILGFGKDHENTKSTHGSYNVRIKTILRSKGFAL